MNRRGRLALGKPTWRHILTLAIAPLLFAGCGTSGESRPGDGAPRPRIALVMKSLANEFFKTMADGAQAHQQAHADDYELVVNGIKDERDLARQVSLVEEMIAQDVDAIVIAPADSKALVPVLRRAGDAGIVVVNIDNKLDSEVLAEQRIAIPFVGPDNRKGAALVGERLAAEVPEGSPVAIIEGIPTAFNSQQRRLGFEDTAAAHGWKVVAVQSGLWEQEPANRVVAAILTEYPDLKALLCCNDNMALGARAAVRAANRAGQVQIVGFDNISAIQDAIRDGSVLATADQHGDQLAVYGIEYALQIHANPAAIPADKDTAVDLVDAATLAAEAREVVAP